MSYIHYGSDTYDPKKVTEYRNVGGFGFRSNKPAYGLWASSKDAEFGWKEWCEVNNLYVESLEKSFEFNLSDNAKILIVDDYSKIEDYVSVVSSAILPVYKINFNRLMKEYDGLELKNICLSLVYLHGSSAIPSVFCGWDCESIVVWNPNVIVPVSTAKETA